jgi:hypothetical protein
MTNKKKDTFVKVPLGWAEAAVKATRAPAALVLIHLLHASWKARSTTFRLSNSYLERNGVSREIKRRVLRDLEAAGLILVERKKGRSPVVTLVVI